MDDSSFRDLIRSVRRRIGPATAQEAETSAGREFLQAALDGGMDELDAGLALAKERAADVPTCRDEFFGYFYRNFGGGGVHPITPDRDSEDLLQSTFAGIWRDLERVWFKGRKSFFAYLHLRKAGKRNEYYRADLRDLDLRERVLHEGREVDPLDEGAADVVAVLAMHLAKDYRDVFLLRARGSSHHEIAERLGIREEASRKRFQIAMNELRKRFGLADPDEFREQEG